MSEAPETIWAMPSNGCARKDWEWIRGDWVAAKPSYVGAAPYRRADLPPTLSAAMEVLLNLDDATFDAARQQAKISHKGAVAFLKALAHFTEAKP